MIKEKYQSQVFVSFSHLMSGDHFAGSFSHSIFLLPLSYAFYPLRSLCELHSHPSPPKARSCILSSQVPCELPSDCRCHPSWSLCDISNDCPRYLLMFLPAPPFICCSLFSELPLCLFIMSSLGLPAV